MYNDYSSISGALGLISVFSVIILIAVAVVFLLTAYPIYVMSVQANLKNPKFAFIPIVNCLNIYNLANLSFWFCLVAFIPYVGVIATTILAAYIHFKIAENFGLSTLGCIIAIFVPLIIYWYIALSKKEFVGTIKKEYLNY